MKRIVKPNGDSAVAWSSFLDQIEKFRGEIGCGEDSIYEPWFRGHANSKTHKLLPSLFRHFPNPDTKDWYRIWETESDLFYEFAARARELHGVLDDDWDILFAMQHYGTPTRLLDWTEVLGVAVYFAILGIDETRTTDENGKK